MATINPAFRRHPDEAALIGRIVVHFGELEVSFCQNNSIALAMHVPMMKALYSLKATSNLASQHIPPWLTLGQQALHLARAQEAEAPPRQPERPPSVLRLTREEWAAKDEKDARLAAEKPEEHSE
jgi:hypothetical protein